LHLPISTTATNHIYHLEGDKYIEWVTYKDNPEFIIGYNIFTEKYNSLNKTSYVLTEQTILTNPLSLSYVIDKSHNQQVHYIGPLMLFIEDTSQIYYDISANESLPDFLFNEINSYKKVDSNISLDSNSYIFKTANYLAYFIVEKIDLNNQKLNNQLEICYKITDPLNPQQYSLVYTQ